MSSYRELYPSWANSSGGLSEGSALAFLGRGRGLNLSFVRLYSQLEKYCHEFCDLKNLYPLSRPVFTCETGWLY